MKIVVIALVLVLGGLAVYNLGTKSIELGNASHELEPFGESRIETVASDKHIGLEGLDAVNSKDDFNAKMIAKLKTDYTDHIAQLSVQASLIKIKHYVLDQFPDEGQERFKQIILAAFPEWADSIFRIIEGLEIYQEWLSEQYLYLEELSPLAKNGALWEKRRELFGQDADLIWQDEKDSIAQSKLRMQEVFHELDQSFELSMDEKLYQLRSAIDENLAGSVQDVAVSEGVISRAFFNLESVQRDLAALSPEERQLGIDNIRRQLGFPEEQIEALSLKDQEREQRWQNGLAYMAERDALVTRLDEASVSNELDALRTKYFKHEAPTIEKEEAMDFWRFKRPRKYGNN